MAYVRRCILFLAALCLSNAQPVQITTTAHGVIVTAGQKQIELSTEIERLADSQPPRTRRQSGGLELTHTLIDKTSGRRCSMVERFSKGSGAGSVRWEVQIQGEGAPWSSPIHTKIRYHVGAHTRFWTAWSSPQDDGEPEQVRRGNWINPLTTIAVPDRRFYYGAPYFTLAKPRIGFSPTSGNLISLPLVSFLEPDQDTGTSLIFSPADPLLDMTLDVGSKGSADFAQHFQRLGAGRSLHFSMDLVEHEADWRGPLRWMVEKYPSYFQPVVQTAHKLGGTSAYSTFEGPVDAPKFRDIAFRTNWKASFDFPYMGMFLPPVISESWTRFAGDSDGKVDPANQASRGHTSIAAMADYSARMRNVGFYVLNYFNVTEFGAHIAFPQPPRAASRDADLWKDPNDWLYQRLSAALLLTPEGRPYYTWGKAVALDCGEPSYQKFLLEQARRHIEQLPQSSGICIDRMDWLRLYNQKRDDGQSWFNNGPARSLYNSWHTLMAKLLPMMHAAGKVVFVNNHVKRIDLLENVDGLFDEFASHAASLNTTAFLALKRPALGWVNDEQVVRENPDAFFQRFLLLGVFPMAPFPGNDHSLLPSAWVDKEYLAYGPLLKALEERTWVLTPHAAEVENNVAQANMFSVPGGFAIVIALGGSASSARVTVRGVHNPVAAMDAWTPGSTHPVAIRQTARGARDLIVDVPLKRGCAILRIK